MTQLAFQEWGNFEPFVQTAIVDELVQGGGGYAIGPERSLLSALLFDGVQAYIMYASSPGIGSSVRYREAYTWVNTRGSDYVFSFDSCCEALGIDADYLRYGLANACNSRSERKRRARRNF